MRSIIFFRVDRDENAVAIASACKCHSNYPVLSIPARVAIVIQFLTFFIRRHTPAFAPVYGGSIVGGFKGGKFVGIAVVPPY